MCIDCRESNRTLEAFVFGSLKSFAYFLIKRGIDVIVKLIEIISFSWSDEYSHINNTNCIFQSELQRPLPLLVLLIYNIILQPL